MFRLICLCIGYCIGCIETAYVVGRIWQVDLQDIVQMLNWLVY